MNRSMLILNSQDSYSESIDIRNLRCKTMRKVKCKGKGKKWPRNLFKRVE